ncbi:hypothetical protein [Pseudomonas sp. KK4]|uniref:hypothetical protein n=1 Tax=Pseudomonas sp. KK4 TaxID=1855729 RepID=UPI00097BA8FC|nr:hypothetical protein [Pseudomonas sp. KK4]
MKALKALIIAALVMPHIAMANERNDLQSCYETAQLPDLKPASPGRELIVVVDQTVPVPEDIQKQAWGQITRFVQPGDSIKLYSFSAFLPGEYLRLIYAGKLDKNVPEQARDDASARKLRTLDQCLARQPQDFEIGFGKLFVKSLRDARQDIPRSEIMNALRKIGDDIKTAEKAPDHVVLLISDMLENSDYTSFYAKNQIKNLVVADELKKAQAHHLFADLSGARVYVTGAGLITDDIKQNYRSGKTMDALNAFWAGYFSQSNASLVGFGTPSLGGDLR